MAIYVIREKGTQKFYCKSADDMRDLQSCTTYLSEQAARTSINSIKIYPGCVFTSRTGINNTDQLEIVPVKLATE